MATGETCGQEMNLRAKKLSGRSPVHQMSLIFLENAFLWSGLLTWIDHAVNLGQYHQSSRRKAHFVSLYLVDFLQVHVSIFWIWRGEPMLEGEHEVPIQQMY
jgi:hypothetical protein